MKKKILYGCWAALYVLCAVLAHIAEPTARQVTAHTLLSILFFVPAAILLIDALREKDLNTQLVLRIAGAVSLGLTLILLIVNILSVQSQKVVGDVLYELLIFVSVPLISCRPRFVSLFLWACLLVVTLPKRKKS